MMAEPIVALDVSDLEAATRLVLRLGDACSFYKVGGELYTAAGPRAVAALRELGKRVFLDLKLHDIPNTVQSAAANAARLGASLLTVHATGGEAMLRAAVEGAGAACGVLAVTVLTSMDAEGVGAAWGREGVVVAEEVVRLAGSAAACGAHGIVCGGSEIEVVRRAHGDRLAILVPGIRLGGSQHDQKRVIDPGEAVRRGARYLVLGRAVTGADDPAAAMARVRDEMRKAAAEPTT